MKKNTSSHSGLFHPRFLFGLTVCGLGLLIAVFSFARTRPAATKAGAPDENGISGPFVAISQAPASFDGDLRTLPAPSGPLPQKIRREHTRHPEGMKEPSYEGFVDRALQPTLPAAPMPAPNVTFKGLDYSAWGDGHPPDVVGDVGLNHYVQAVNTAIGVYDKTGTRLAAFTYNTFFNAGGGTGTLCDTDNYGDPIVVYDTLANRWIVSDFAFATDAGGNTVGPYYECIAVSKTDDPVNGGWWLYPVLAHATDFPDYPKFGVWPDGIYMSANIFDAAGDYAGVRVWAFNRDDLYSGAPLRQISFSTGTGQWSLLPSNFRGTPPPAGRPNYMVSIQENVQFGGSNVRVHRFKITDWSTMSATFTGPTNVAVATYRLAPYLAPYVPELGGETLDTLGDRLMMQNQYRNINGVESLWNMHTVIVPTAGPQTGIRWYQLNVTDNVIATAPVQQSTYAPDTTYRWMGSLAVDKQGNMAMGYSVSNPTIFPAIRYSGRLATDPIDTLPQTETSLFEGTGPQAAGFTRWGDYSAMSVDPTDDCTFWYTQMYYEAPGATPGDWQTRIGSFKFPGCVGTTLPVQLNSVVSRKDHGPGNPFDLTLPLTGSPAVECRSGGASNQHTLVFTFADPLTSVSGASVTNGTGTVSSSAIGADTHQYVVNLENVTDAQVITVTLADVNDDAGHISAAVPISMAVLLGDTTANGTVNSSDIGEAKANSGQPTNADNFKTDVTVNGTVNSSDIGTIKAQSGAALPP